MDVNNPDTGSFIDQTIDDSIFQENGFDDPSFHHFPSFDGESPPHFTSTTLARSLQASFRTPSLAGREKASSRSMQDVSRGLLPPVSEVPMDSTDGGRYPMDLETALKGLNLDLTLEDVELSAIAMSPRGEFRGDKGGFMGGESDEGLRKDGNGLLGDERDKEFGGNSSAFFDGESGELNSDRHAAIEENGQAKAKSVNEGNNGVGEHSRQSSAQSGGRTKIPVMYGRRMSESGGRRGLMEPTTGDGRSRGEIGEEEMRQSMARRFDALISDQLENADRALSQVTYTPEPSRPGTISPNAQFESFDLVHSVPSLSPSQTSPPTARATPNMRTRTIPTMRSTPSLSTTRDIFGLGRLPSPRPHDLAASQGSQRSNQPYYSNAKDINETIAEMDPPSSFFAMSVGSELRSPPVPYSNSFIIPPPRSAPTNLGASKGSAGGATRRFMAASSPNLATTMRFANGAMGGEESARKIPEVSFLSDVSANPRSRGFESPDLGYAHDDHFESERPPLFNETFEESEVDRQEMYFRKSRGNASARAPSLSPQRQAAPSLNVDTLRRTSLSPTRHDGPLSAASSRSVAGSMYYQAPDLAGLADPGRKGSMMSLHDQGASIIPSIVDLVGPVRHMGLGHLPEETSSKAVQNALRTLQEKVAQLENERVSSRERIQSLENNLAEARKLLQVEKPTPPTNPSATPSASPAPQPSTFVQNPNAMDSLSSSVLRRSISTNSTVRRENVERRVRCLEDELDATRRALEIEQHRVRMSREAETNAHRMVQEAEQRARALQGAMMSDRWGAERLKEEVLGRAAKGRGLSPSRGVAVDEKATASSYLEGGKKDVEVQVGKPENLIEEWEGRAAPVAAWEAPRSVVSPSAAYGGSSGRGEGVGSSTSFSLSSWDPQVADQRQAASSSPCGTHLSPNGTSPRHGDARETPRALVRKPSSLVAQPSEKEVQTVPEMRSMGISPMPQERPIEAKDTVRKTEDLQELDEAKNEKIDLEVQLEQMRGRASFLERQLDYARGLQQSAQSERDVLRRELFLLRHGIGDKEKRLSALLTSPPRPAPSSGRSSRQAGASSSSSVPSPFREEKYPSWKTRKEEEDRSGKFDRKTYVPVNMDDVSVSMVAENNSFLDSEEIERLKLEIDGVRRGADKQSAELLVRRAKGGEGKMTRMPRNGKSTPSVAAPETRGRDASKTMQWKKLEGARPPSRVSASNERHSRSRSRSLRDEDLTWDGRDSHGREMPFVVGKNTGKSHSVTANLQKVFSMLKTHNPALCSVCSRRRQSKEASRESSKRRDASPQGRRSHREASGSTPPLTDEDEFRGRLRDDQALLHFELAKEGAADGGTEGLERILRFLESEQADYKSNYQHLVREYERLADLGSKNGGKGSHEEQRKLRQIGDELRNVIQDMDSKGDQIRILRDIMASSSRLVTQKAQKSSAKGERDRRAKAENDLIKAEEELARSLRVASPPRKRGTAVSSSLHKETKKTVMSKPVPTVRARSSGAGNGLGSSAGSRYYGIDREGTVGKGGLSSGRSTPSLRLRTVEAPVTGGSRQSRRRSPSPARSAASLHLLRNSLRVQEALLDDI